MLKSLKRIATVFILGVAVFAASPAQATPSNDDLHKMILGVMNKLDKVESENKALKKQLTVALRKLDGRQYAALSSQGSNGISVKPVSPRSNETSARHLRPKPQRT